jgi:multimeric flavodoxin WrbA
MKKVFAIIGSPRAASSNTCSLVTDFLDLVREIDPAVEYEVASMGKRRIEPCKGCWSCAEAGRCPMDDDLADLRAKLLGSDLVVVGSPIFADQVSAQTKAFVDRSFLWSFTLGLIGKPSLTAITASFSDMAPVEGYLDNILCSFGTIPIGHLRRYPYRPSELSPQEACRREYRGVAERVVAILDGREVPTPTSKNTQFFEGMKGRIQSLPSRFAKEHWTARGWFGKSFAEAQWSEG